MKDYTIILCDETGGKFDVRICRFKTDSVVNVTEYVQEKYPEYSIKKWNADGLVFVLFQRNSTEH